MSGSFHHFTLSERIEIERMLSVCATASEIASKLGFSRQSVVREVARGTTEMGRVKSYGRSWNGCAHQRRCQLRHVCGHMTCNKKCSACRSYSCIKICAVFEMNICPHLTLWPRVCNGCPEYKTCSYPRYLYQASVADARAKGLLVSSRQGFNLTEDELAQIARITSPLLKARLSPGTIWMAYKNTLPCSARTFYRLVHAGLLESVCTIDLPFAVRYRPRKQEKPPRRSNISKESLRGRTYEDFLLLDADEKMHATEMDCVCGKSTDSSILLTIFWRVWKFQLVVLLASHTSEEVIRQLDLLERSLIGSFPAVMLVDRGHEFCNAKMIERAKHEYYEDGCRCSLFYCDPMRSDQRALSENNHRLIRRIIPKGTSLDDLSQEQVSLMCSHINSMPRASLDGKSPMSLAMEKLPEQFFFDYGLKLITPDKIILRPDLLDSI